MRTVRALLAASVLGLAVPAVSGHPMGNFSVNRFARLEPSDRGVRLVYLVDFAEIPSFQELSKFPDLAANLDPASLNQSPTRIALARDLESAWLAGLTLSTEAGPIRFHPNEASIQFSAGAGGLPTMKLRIESSVAWPKGFRRETLRYADENAPDRLGWREVVVRSGEGVALSGDFATDDRSHELTDYPADPTADIPQVVKATIGVALAGFDRSPLATPSRHGRETRGVSSLGGWGPVARERGRASGPGPSPSAQAGLREPEGKRTAAEGREDLPSRGPGLAAGVGERESSRAKDRFADLVARRQLTPGIVLLSLLIAASLGGLHALSPGHGKTIVAAYLVGSRGTAKHALLLGLVVTASHTIGVFLLGIVTLALSKAVVPEKLYPAIQFLSGVTIVVIGAALFVRRLARRGPESHGHSHAVEVPREAPTASALLALGVSGGILPCPSALVVLLSAIALHRTGFGLVLIVSFSAGLAAVLSAIGILVVRAGRLLGKFESAGAWARRLPAFSALLIGALGLAIAARAFTDIQKAFF